MWKRDEAVKPSGPAAGGSSAGRACGATGGGAGRDPAL